MSASSPANICLALISAGAVLSPYSTRMVTVDSGVLGRGRGAFDDVDDISAVPDTVHTDRDGRPLAPIAGPIVV